MVRGQMTADEKEDLSEIAQDACLYGWSNPAWNITTLY